MNDNEMCGTCGSLVGAGCPDKTGIHEKEAGHDYPAARVERELLSDGSYVFNLIIEPAKLYCINEKAAMKYRAEINGAITNAILGL